MVLPLGGVLACQASFFYHSPPVPIPPPPPPPLTELFAPKNAGAMWRFLIVSPSIGDPSRGRGFEASPPIFGLPRRHG